MLATSGNRAPFARVELNPGDVLRRQQTEGGGERVSIWFMSIQVSGRRRVIAYLRHVCGLGQIPLEQRQNPASYGRKTKGKLKYR